MNKKTKEIAFEEAIENHLLNKGGYIKGKPDQFDPKIVLDQQLQNTIYPFEHKQGVVEKAEMLLRKILGKKAG